MSTLTDSALDQIFRTARTHGAWQDRPVTDEQLHALYELMKFGPTSLNTNPVRLVFVKSAEAKAKLKPVLAPGNVDKTMAAPVTVIVGYDLAFYEKLPQLVLHMDARPMFIGKDAHIQTTAFRNGSLQGAYLMIAARALGLDCGPMSGFDNAKLDEAFFAGTSIKSNFLCNLGYGEAEKLRPRGPRLAFDEAASIL
jgi:3-hydroxypropanoate dehydrogenase